MLDDYLTLGEIVPSFNSRKRRLLYDHIEWLRRHPETVVEPTRPEYAFPEIHSFYAYCKLADIAEEQIYPIMLLNDITNPMEFTIEKYPQLTIPSLVAVSSVLGTEPT
ncbi:MAG: hypothetical protein ACRDBQ_18545 [Shewanella sp.]